MAERTRRGRRGRVVWIAGSILCALFVLLVVPFLAIRVAPIRAWILRESVERRLLPPDWSLRIDAVSRFDPWGLEVEGIRLDRASPEGERPWALLTRLELRWRPADLLRNRIWADRIVIDSLVVRADRPAPRLAAGSARGEGGGAGVDLPWLRLDAFQVGYRVVGEEGTIARGNVAMESLEHRDGRIQAVLREGRLFYRPETIEVVVGSGLVGGSLARAIRLSGLKIRAPGLEAWGSGELRLPGSSDSTIHATVVCSLASFRPGLFGPLARRLPGLSPSDSLSGLLRIEIDPSLLSLRADLAGRLLDGRLEALSLIAERSGETIEVIDLDLAHRLGRIVAEGRVDPAAGEAAGIVRFEDLDVGDPSLARWLAGWPETAVEGEARGRARWGGDGPPSAAGEVRIDSAALLGARWGPAVAAGTLADRIVTVDSLRVGEPGEGIGASGRWSIPAGRIEAAVRVSRFPLDRWVDPLLGIGLEGAVEGELRLAGPVGQPAVRGSLAVDRFRVEGVSARAARLDSIAGTLLPPRIDGRVRAESLDVYAIPFDSADFRVDWEETIRVDLRASLDTLVVRAAAEVVPAEPGSVTLRDWEILPGALAPWRSERPARVRWSRGEAWIEEVALSSEDGRIRGELHVEAGGGSWSGSARLDRLALESVGRIAALPDSALAGTASLAVEVGGDPDHPILDLDLSAEGVVAARWPVGPVRGRLAVERAGAIRIDSLRAGSGEGRGTLRVDSLRVDPGRPLTALLQALADSLRPIVAETRISGNLRIEEVRLSDLVRTALEAAPRGPSGLFAPPEDPMAARIRVVRPGEPDAGEGIADRIGGDLAVAARLDGSGRFPRVRARARIDGLHLYRARADSVLAIVSAGPDAVSLERFEWIRLGNVSRAEGSYPLQLSLVPGLTRVDPLGPVRLDAELPEIDLGILRAISREIVEPEGVLAGRLALRGTPRRIWPEGMLTIREGGMRIPNREERIRGIEARLTLDSTGVVIERAAGRIGAGGRISASGTFRDLAAFDLEGTVRDAVVFETGLYHFKVDGDFRAFPVEEEGEKVPLVVGTVEVLEGAIIGDLAKAPQPPAGSSREPSPWRAEIDVYAPGNIRLQTAVASVDLGEAENLHVSFDDPQINVSGGVRVLGGRYRVFNNIFTIRSGTVEFLDTGRGAVEPILDVHARTQVRIWAGDRGEAETEGIEIHVTGPVTALNLAFSSDSDRSTDEIIALLSVGRLRDESGGIGVTSSSRDYLLTEVVSQIESQISQLVGPLQNVTVLPGDEPGAAWQLNVRQTILPQVSLAYTRELASAAGQEVSVQYNLGGQLYLNAAVETRQEEGAPAERYSLDLKLRFEYK